MNIECRILHYIHVLEVAVQLVLGLAAEDFGKDLREALQLMWIVREPEFAGQLVALDLVVHGDQCGFPAVEQNGCFDVSRVACL